MKFYIQKKLIKITGATLSICPFFILQALVSILATVSFPFLRKKINLAEHNIRNSFSMMTEHYVKKLALTSFKRTIEQGLLTIAWPYLSHAKILNLFPLSKKNLGFLSANHKASKGVIWMIPHFCHADALSFLKPEIQVNALYRPLSNPAFDDFVKKSRQRFGVKTIDRKDGGMLKTLKVLKRGEILAMLFDQNAGGAGTRLSFLGRECSCTTLPDILNEKFKPRILFVYTRRIGFWRSSIEVEEMGSLNDGQLVIERANVWLEGKLRDDNQLQESWLWMHQRWKPGAGQTRKGKIR